MGVLDILGALGILATCGSDSYYGYYYTVQVPYGGYDFMPAYESPCWVWSYWDEDWISGKEALASSDGSGSYYGYDYYSGYSGYGSSFVDYGLDDSGYFHFKVEVGLQCDPDNGYYYCYCY